MDNVLENTEKEILGAILQGGEVSYQHCLKLRPEMMGLDSHRRIYALMIEMMAAGTELDVLTLRNELDKRRMLEAVGGIGYVLNLEDGIPRRFNPSNHVAKVIEAWKLREVQRICSVFSARVEENERAGDLLGEMQAQVMDALEENEKRDEPLVADYSRPYIEEWIEQTKADPSKLMGMSYGIPTLDALTEGMMPGEVTTVGARSGVGKSTLMLQTSHDAIRNGIAVHLFSLEMTRKQCLHRLWSLESGVSFSKIRKASYANEAEISAVKLAAWRIADMPLRIHDKADLNLSQIGALARLSIRQHGTQLFCVDYAQNVEAEGRDERARVSKVSSTLTKLAKSEGAHLMILSQLRKVPPEMYGKPPHVGDLRETGQLENDAHCVLLLHRGWDEDAARVADHGEIIVPKQRSGETGSVAIIWNRRTATFEDGNHV